MLSDAVGLERVSRIVGYKLTPGDFSPTSPNLPQRIAIIGQANTANQSGLDTNPKRISSAKDAGEAYGYGSPIHQVARILKPVFGDGVGGVPVYAYPQFAATGAVAKVTQLAVVGTATASGTHTLVVSGRRGIDGASYSFAVAEGDTATDIASRIADTLNNVLAAPCTAVATAANVDFTAKWADESSEFLYVEVDNGGDGLGLSYGFTDTASGAGTTTFLGDSLEQFGEDWNTIVVNTYGLEQSSILDDLEAFNGRPDPNNPTGRYEGIVMKPFIALTGTGDDDVEDIATSYTDSRKNEVTNSICLATATDAFPGEIAANYAVLFAKSSQNTPHLDIGGSYLPDLPINRLEDILETQKYDHRDQLVKVGCSTVKIVNEQYQVQDFVTTYRPDGEAVPQYRYCRNLMLDFNVRYGYYLLEEVNVLDHTIVNDDDFVTAQNIIKPKQWIAIINAYAEDLARRALIADPSFMQDSILVQLSSVNPDRLETFFRYKRTGVVRIAATTAEAGFNFGTN